jgi:ferrochelatase
MKQKIVVVLMNLGGPDSLTAVRPFLFNLFYDRAILNLPNPFRYLLARWISFSRNKKAKGIYSLIGGKSPILENTLIQAKRLRSALEGDFDVMVVPAMRYWRPRTTNVLEVVNAFNPSKVVLLPLYPQFSTTTTKSSTEEWKKIAPQWQSKTVIEHCYFNDADFVKAHQELIKPILSEAKKYGAPRILFSAHGLPQKVIDGGDPYQRQIEASVAAIMQDFDGTDFVICYQSKVGGLKWLTPTTEDELKRAGSQSTPVVVVPISFVSEHSETLVELDIDYAKKAKTWGVPFYGRAPALGDNPSYMKCLENAVRRLVA